MSIQSITPEAALLWGPPIGSIDSAQAEIYVPHPENERRRELNRKRRSAKAKKAAKKARRRNRR